MDQFDFSFDPLCVGDISTVGFMEDLLEKQADDAVDYIYRVYGNNPTVKDIDETLEKFDIDYQSMPRFIRDKFDQFEVE